MHVGAGVDAQLLVWGCGAHESLGVAAQMQSHARPIADAQHRHRDLAPLRLRAVEGAAVEIIVQPEIERVGAPSIGIVLGRAADDVVHQMRQVPVRHEQAEQAAVEQRVAVDIGEAFPRNNRLQRWRLVIGDEPLVDGEIGYAQQPDLARAPRLRRCPLDRVIEIDGFCERPWFALARGFTAAAAVDAHRGITPGHPPVRVDGLPIHQRVRFFL